MPDRPDPMHRGYQSMSQTVVLTLEREKKSRDKSYDYDIMLNGQKVGSVKNGQSISLTTDFACNSLVVRKPFIFSCLFFTLPLDGQAVITINDNGVVKDKCCHITLLSEEEMQLMVLQNAVSKDVVTAETI